ncbi:protein rogdi homolog [Dendronephthya gigantea]|uniref:protein rogdi homolog n=1 Tax=Dendronephthya gigantea TaxID=151771 RepID=UPI00106CE183|nr:protein rogdi homolog [Dendronephthya gigantea]
MAATTSEEEELRVMRLELQWLLEKQVPSILRKVESVLKACDETFNEKPQKKSEDGSEKPDKFLLKTPSIDVLKGYVTVNGDSITNAELKLKVPKIANGNIHTYIKEGHPWRLSQVQDAKNNLQLAIEKIKEGLAIETFTTGMQINEMMDELISDISRGKASLSVPEKHTVAEIMSNGSLNAFKPSLPSEVVVNFHVNCHKLIFTIYVLNTLSVPPPPSHSQKSHVNSNKISSVFEHGGKWFEIINRFEVECVVSWLEDAFRLIAIALQLCQQIKDKVGVFSRITEE